MKYCIYCGSQIADEAVICVHCGRMVNDRIMPERKSASNLNVLCILGFIFSFVASIVGLILSIVGYNQVKNTNDATSKNLAKAGIIISAIGLGIVAVVVFYCIIVFGFFLTGVIL